MATKKSKPPENIEQETSPKHPGGRPSKYDHDKTPQQALKLCLLGATDKQLADFFDVCEDTINAWKHDHPKFSESLKAGKSEADAVIAASLFKRAKGFDHEDVHICQFQGEVIITPIRKIYAPDTTACIFWLKNRQPEYWRDKTDLDVTSNGEKVTAFNVTVSAPTETSPQGEE